MARLTRDRHIDAMLKLIAGSFRSYQEQGKFTQQEVASTFLGLVGQLECSLQLTAEQQALCREIYGMVARISSKQTPQMAEQKAATSFTQGRVQFEVALFHRIDDPMPSTTIPVMAKMPLGAMVSAMKQAQEMYMGRVDVLYNETSTTFYRVMLKGESVTYDAE